MFYLLYLRKPDKIEKRDKNDVKSITIEYSNKFRYKQIIFIIDIINNINSDFCLYIFFSIVEIYFCGVSIIGNRLIRREKTNCKPSIVGVVRK